MYAEKTFYSACFGFATGVLWRSLSQIDIKSVIFVGVAYLVLAIFSSFILKKNWDIYLSVFILALILGIIRFQVADVKAPAYFENQVDKTASFSALIDDEPAKNTTQTKLIVEAEASSSKSAAIKTRIVVFVKSEQGKNENGAEFHYGDEIQIIGKLEKPANFMTDQDMEFDYVNYLRKDGIFYVIQNPQIEILSRGHGNQIKSWLFYWREKFDVAVAKAIPSPESIVLGGIIIGERYAFSQQLRQIFVDTGTIHIVTIGGYHVTLVAQWIMKIFSFLPELAGIGAGIGSIFFYVIATGGAQTSIRAGIMATLALFASATGRMYASGRALILAAVIMILINPFVLVFDVSFELSFMATIAIIFLSPHLEPYFKWISWKWLRGIVAITSSMYVFALPFVLYRIGTLSLTSLPANILIVPLMPITMIAGFITGFAGLISPLLAIIPGQIATAILYFQIAVVAFLAHLPFAAVPIQNFSLPIIVVIYTIFGWIFFKGNAEEKIKKQRAKSKDEEKKENDNKNCNCNSNCNLENITKEKNSSTPKNGNLKLLILLLPLIITFSAAGFLYYSHWKSNRDSLAAIDKLLSNSNASPSQTASTSSTSTKLEAASTSPSLRTRGSGLGTSSLATNIFTPDPRTKSSDCKINGVYPDHACTPGAIFTDATKDDVCVKGYTATVRNVSTATKKQVFEEYGISYPQPTGAYEVDHFIPLALGGANDIANLFPEAAAPVPGFHEKDVVEVFLQEEVCSGRASLAAAQRQISTDWLAVYKNIPADDKQRIIEKYGDTAVQ